MVHLVLFAGGFTTTGSVEKVYEKFECKVGDMPTDVLRMENATLFDWAEYLNNWYDEVAEDETLVFTVEDSGITSDLEAVSHTYRT